MKKAIELTDRYKMLSIFPISSRERSGYRVGLASWIELINSPKARSGTTRKLFQPWPDLALLASGEQYPISSLTANAEYKTYFTLESPS